MTDVARFYDDLAHYYHLLFESWEESIARQSAIWDRLLEREIGPGPHKILDAACGIGTQSLGFARAGHEVTGSDLSPAAIRRAKIGIGASAFNDRWLYTSNRLVNYMACGTFYLCRWFPGIDQVFIPGVHLETFRDWPELTAKIGRYLKHENERNLVAKLGMEYVRREFRPYECARRILDVGVDYAS